MRNEMAGTGTTALTPALSPKERENGPPGFGMREPAVVQGFQARITHGKVTLGVQNIKKGRVIHHRAGGRRMAVKKSGLIWFDLV